MLKLLDTVQKKFVPMTFTRDLLVSSKVAKELGFSFAKNVVDSIPLYNLVNRNNNFSIPPERIKDVKMFCYWLSSVEIESDLVKWFALDMGGGTIFNVWKREFQITSMMGNDIIADYVSPLYKNREFSKRPAIDENKVKVIVLPKNAPMLTFMKSAVIAWALGYKVVVKFSSHYKRVAPILGKVIETFFPGMTVLWKESGKSFLYRLIKGEILPEVGLGDFDVDDVIIYGHDKMINYELLIIIIVSPYSINLYFEGPGNDILLAFSHSDLKLLLDTSFESRMNNSGKSCCSKKRDVIWRGIHADYISGLRDMVKGLICGPLDLPNVQVVPVTDSDFNLHEKLIADAVYKGAIAYTGRSIDEVARLKKLRIPVPTILQNCSFEMNVMKDESVTPLWTVMKGDNIFQFLKAMFYSSYRLNISLFGKYPRWIRYLSRISYRGVCIDNHIMNPIYLIQFMLNGGGGNSGFKLRIFQKKIARNLAIHFQDDLFHDNNPEKPTYLAILLLSMFVDKRSGVRDFMFDL